MLGDGEVTKMKRFNKLKLWAIITLVAGISTTQVFAQVSTQRLTCLDYTGRMSFEVHFQNNQVTLDLKGHTYRLPYNNAFVSKKGERWSAYANQEIWVLTTIPYDRYVTLQTPSGVGISSSFDCK
jgi:hypothetical protein